MFLLGDADSPAWRDTPSRAWTAFTWDCPGIEASPHGVWTHQVSDSRACSTMTIDGVVRLYVTA